MERKSRAGMIGGILLLLGIVCAQSEGFRLIEDEIDNFISHMSRYQPMNVTTLHRNRREDEDEACDCGPDQMVCHHVKGRKICQCTGDRYVIEGMCDDCACGAEGVCDFRHPIGSPSHCKCSNLHYRDEEDNKCKPCSCGPQAEGCAKSHNLQVCECPNTNFVLGVDCEDCICPGTHTVCYYRLTETPCSCPLSKKCGSCVCDDVGQCRISEYVKNCRCLDGYIKTEGDLCKPCSCKPDQICIANGTEAACSCNNTHYMDPKGDCAHCGCHENEICIDSNGNNPAFRCVCRENYYLSNGKCKECFCGENHECVVDNGEKICHCLEQHKEFDGICIECFCGEGHNCELVDGVKVCRCLDKHIEVEGQCLKCDCGENHTCSFQDGIKVCQCAPGFALSNGECRECICGNHSGCFFRGNEKVCICQSGFADFQGKCHPTCSNDSDCFNEGKCTLHDNSRFCRCNRGVTGDHCEIVEDCHMKLSNCTDGHGTCQYSLKSGRAYCKCDEFQKFDSIRNRCDECFCGKDHDCIFQFGKKECRCIGYAEEKDGLCIETCGKNTCIHGFCEILPDSTIQCSCENGYTGPGCAEEAVMSQASMYLIPIVSVVAVILIAVAAILIIKKKRSFYRKLQRISNANAGASTFHVVEPSCESNI